MRRQRSEFESDALARERGSASTSIHAPPAKNKNTDRIETIINNILLVDYYNTVNTVLYKIDVVMKEQLMRDVEATIFVYL
jgi:hypothetical protein